MLPHFPHFITSSSGTHQRSEFLDYACTQAWPACSPFEGDVRDLPLRSELSTGGTHWQPGGPSTSTRGTKRKAVDDGVCFPSPSPVFWLSTSAGTPHPPPSTDRAPFSLDPEDPKRDVPGDSIGWQLGDMSGSRFPYTHEIVGPNPYEEARVMQYTIALAAEYAETLANVAQEALDQVSKKASQATEHEFSTGAAAPSEVILPPPSKRRKTMAGVPKKKKKNAGASKSAPKKPGRSAKGEENCRRTACLYPGCSYSYTRPHDRDRHMQSHFEPQYHCEVPGCRRDAKGFFRHDALRRHMNSEHPGLEYVSKQLPFPWHSNTELIWKLKMPPADDFDPESCFLRRERQKMALHT